MQKRKRVFFDHASATPLDRRVLRAMGPFLQKGFANPQAIYKEGVQANRQLEDFRIRVARALGVTKNEIIFTGGGTEADNLAILGVFDATSKIIKKPHIVTTSFEHPAILETTAEARRRGAEITLLPVSKDGFVSPEQVLKALTSETVLVTIMQANNEIGTIQPLAEIARLLKAYREKKKGGREFPYLHTDASQAANYRSVEAQRSGVDLMTLDGSKIYGPKGVGVLMVKREVKISPHIFGGGQERGLRSGTENLAAIAGFTVALEVTQMEREKEIARLTLIRNHCVEKILESFKGAELNGGLHNRLPNNVNICFPGQDGEFIVVKLDSLGFACSSSSSCRSSSENTSSHVIEAIGKRKCKESSVRFTFGRSTRKVDIDNLVKALSFLRVGTHSSRM